MMSTTIIRCSINYFTSAIALLLIFLSNIHFPEEAGLANYFRAERRGW